MSVGEHCPVIQLCPTHFHTLCPFQCFFFLDKEQLGESIKLAAALGSVNWFYWVLLGFTGPCPTAALVPSVHKHTRGATPHFNLKHGNFCDFTEISLHWPPTFSFWLFLFLSSPWLLSWFAEEQNSEGQTLCGSFALQERTFFKLWAFFHHSAAVSHPSSPALSKGDWIWFALSSSSAWTLTQWNWAAWDEIILFIQKWNF